MFFPQTYFSALLLMIATMLCWGSWASTQKLAKNWRFECFYWDYAFGVLITSLIFASTLGYLHQGAHFTTILFQSTLNNILLALASGALFNVANIVLVAAIDLAGMAVAFPIGIGIALILGTLLSYIVNPIGNWKILSVGVVMVLMAIFFDAKAYQKISTQQKNEFRKGLFLSIISGVFMGLFYPLIAKSMKGEHALDPYSANVLFAFGLFICNLPLNSFLMKYSLTGKPVVHFSDYSSGSMRSHFLGLLGGMLWCMGMTFNLIAAHRAGPAVAYAMGQGATLVAAIWGVLIWREFKTAQGNVKPLLSFMFISYILGLVCIGVA